MFYILNYHGLIYISTSDVLRYGIEVELDGAANW